MRRPWLSGGCYAKNKQKHAYRVFFNGNMMGRDKFRRNILQSVSGYFINMRKHAKIRIRYQSMYELKMRSQNSQKLIRVFQVGRETKRCVSLYVLVTTNYSYTFEHYMKTHNIVGRFKNVKPPSCVNSYFLFIMCLFVTPQIILEFICHDSSSSMRRSCHQILL